MSFLRHGEIYHFDEGAISHDRAPAHRNDEFPAGYSLAGCTPAEPASASPAGRHLAGKPVRSTIEFQRTAGSVLTVCLSSGDNPNRNDGPRNQKIQSDLKAAGLAVGEDGKGRSCWMAYGYVLASGRAEIIALHDCDIVNYSREMLARLCYPVADLRIDYVFSKGYYARVTDRMHGRVTRLLISPLVRSLERLVGHHPFLAYLDSFRYPLAGEFCMYADMARINRIPGDWGLEVGVLAEVYRNFSVQRICQVDLADNYEHKHQSLSADDPQKGLMRMTVDIGKTLFRTLAAEGVVLPEGILRTLQAQYVRSAEDTITRFYADARINGLSFDRHAEEDAVHAFARGLRLAAESFLADPLGTPLIPNWNRVVAAIPDIFARLNEAVEIDNT